MLRHTTVPCADISLPLFCLPCNGELTPPSTDPSNRRDCCPHTHTHRTGPGAQCDGEDWFAVSASPYLDYATVHIYERHMELLPVCVRLSWASFHFFFRCTSMHCDSHPLVVCF